MPLFHITAQGRVNRISSNRFERERQLQSLVEGNLPEIFGVRFIASEFAIQGEQLGRIDTLGLDLDGAPTIIEYKRTEAENVINQGLYYMNWLLDHRGDFTLAAQKALGGKVEISWNSPRLIILAQSYAKWDIYAVRRMAEGIELWTYTLYSNGLLYLDLVYGQQRTLPPISQPPGAGDGEPERGYTLEYHLDQKPESIRAIFQAIRGGILAWASEEGGIIETPNKLYIGYRHGRNFCEIQVQARGLKVYLDLTHAELADPEELARDVAGVGHWGTGDVEIKIEHINQVEYALGLIQQSYRMTL
jgi:predicted transport protein